MSDKSPSIPNERDQIDGPHRPDLRCDEHEAYCELLHSLLNRLMRLESQVATLEKKWLKRELKRLKGEDRKTCPHCGDWFANEAVASAQSEGTFPYCSRMCAEAAALKES